MKNILIIIVALSLLYALFSVVDLKFVSSPPNLSAQDKALMEAVFKNQIEEVATLREEGASPNAIQHPGLTPLKWASRHSPDTRLVKLLLENGADVNVNSDVGTALECASKFRNIKHIQILKSYGAE